MEDSQFAAALSAQLESRIGAQRFELWFSSQARLCVRASCLTVRAASTFVRDWLRTNLADEIRACWEAIAGHGASIEFAVDATLVDAIETKATSGAATPLQPTIAHPPALTLAAADKSASKGENCLTGFVVGASNEYAFRAAELIARGRQQASPVLFCGPTGVGKTHLLRAVVREYRRQHPHGAAVYLSAEQFTTSFIEAIRGSGLPSFRQKCRGAKLLAIDDLQFFAGKQRTLEELLHTLDTLATDGKRVVLASDRALAELRSLGPELVSRLSGGLICDIEPPEFATRLEIVRRLAHEADLTLDEHVLSMVATQITTGARELRGALHRLAAVSLAFEKPITRELAGQALADMARHCTRTVRLADVQKVVCDVFGVEPAQLRSDRKGRSLAEPRMLAMWLARKYTRAPWSEIGAFFGRRSHSTVISAHKRVEKLISTQASIGVNDQSCGVEDAIRRLETALRSA